MVTPTLSELTPMLFNMWLTHLGSVASKYAFNSKALTLNKKYIEI